VSRLVSEREKRCSSISVLDDEGVRMRVGDGVSE
jgi:hypothetical protein